MARSGEQRELWRYAMPGITGDTLLKAANRMDLTSRDSPQNMSDAQFEILQEGCRVLLGLGEDWAEDGYLEAVGIARSKGWGTLYGPGSPPAQKVHKARTGTNQDSLQPGSRGSDPSPQ